MNFYAKRTVEQQRRRLPSQFRDNYEATQLDRIKIDGVEIMGYFEYSFLEEKSYVEQPTRSADGSIEGINDYTTFLTPRLIIKYNMMGIDDYRTLMKLLKSKNAFMVECYDVVEDRRVVHEMYFAPPSMPIIYQQYLMALGIQEYTIELIGTNSSKTVLISYDYNIPEIAKPTPYDGEVILYTDDRNKMVSIIQFDDLINYMATKKFTFKGWNTLEDGTGDNYEMGKLYYLYKDLYLYAQWDIISFKIYHPRNDNTTTFYASSTMTWGDWVNSGGNMVGTQKEYFAQNGLVFHLPDHLYVKHSNGTLVYLTETINADETYYCQA